MISAGRSGVIINNSSGWGIAGGDSAVAYCASKGGVVLLTKAMAIDHNVFGLQQFVLGKPIWESYLKGEEPDPKVAMTKVMEAVQAEIKKG